jgi:2'-5' RNA ligase
LRLFFAVLPPVEVRNGIAEAALRLPLEAGSAPVPAENYHMTLAFIGEVPAAQLSTVRGIGASQRACAFTVRLDAYEYWRDAAVLVAVAREIPASLARLWERLQAGLASHRLAGSPPPLRPHVTIARKVSQAPVLQAMSAFAWRAQTFSLMQSSRSGARPTQGLQPIYTVLDTWPLLDE